MAAPLAEQLELLRSDAYQFLDAAGEATNTQRDELLTVGEELRRRCSDAGDPEAEAIVLTGQSVMARDDRANKSSLALLDEAERLAASARPDVVARTLMHRVTVYIYLGQFADALEAGERAREHLSPELLPRLLSNIALTYKRQEHWEPALETFAEAVRAAEAVNDGEAMAVIRCNRGLLAIETGDFNAAEIEFRTALLQPGGLSQFRRAVGEHNLGVVMCKQGLLRSALVHMDRAEPFMAGKGPATLEASNDRCEALFSARLLSRAFDLIETNLDGLAESDPLRAETLMLAARIATAAEDSDLALDFANRAEEAFRRLGLDLSSSTAASLVSVLDFSQTLPSDLPSESTVIAEALAVRARNGPTEDARRAALSALSERAVTGPTDETLTFWAKGQLAVLDGRAPAAIDALSSAFLALERALADLDSAELRAHLVDGIAPLESLSVQLAVLTHSSQDFRRWIGRARQLVSRTSPGPADPGLGERLDELRKVSADLKSGIESEAEVLDLEWQRQQLQRRIQFVSWTALPDQLADAAHTKDNRATTSEQAPDLGLSGIPDFTNRISPEFPGTANETITYGQTQTRLFGVGPAEPDRVVELGAVEDLERLVRKFQLTTGLVAQSSRRPGPRQIRAVMNTAREFDQLFVAPLVHGINSPISIQPSGGLMGVPWRLLPSLTGRVVHVLPTHSITHREAHQTSATGTVAVCAGPNLQSDEEAQSIAELYPDALLLTGRQATASAVRDLMGQVDTIHLLAHGFRNSKDPLMSSLRFHDGDLTLYDFETLPRAPRTVILASCRVGSAASNHAASYGLGSVLVRRGCSQAVASVAAISESETAVVMRDLHRGLGTGTSAAQVLADLRYDNPFTQLAGDMLIALSPDSAVEAAS